MTLISHRPLSLACLAISLIVSTLSSCNAGELQQKPNPTSVIQPAPTTQSQILDQLRLGDQSSEQAHHLTSDYSETLVGSLNQPARRLLPLTQVPWEGGRCSFTLKVDPAQQNYFTAKFWGSEGNPNRLMLFCEGKQIGYRHLGDIDILDFGSDNNSGPCPGRFYYNTSPLPLAMTQGKTQLHFEIRATGPIWGYGTTFDKYQKNMTQPTRGIYGAYTHIDGFFSPPVDEVQGLAPTDPPTRQSPGPEVLEQLKQRVNGTLTGILNSAKPLNQVQMHLLAKAYHVPWTIAYHKPAAVEQIAKACDALFVAYHQNPKLAESDPAVYNSDWFGLGMAGDAIRLLAQPLQSQLQMPVVGSENITRKIGWSQMLQASRDWHRRNRRMYTNQSMIIDLNIYRANRGIEAIDPAHALPEAQMLRYLYESIGLQPWLGSETDHGPQRPFGDNYFQLTAKGLTRELGFVGYYGEVLDWVTQIYEATKAPGSPGNEGDLKIKTQLEKIAIARAPFRYPAIDDEGFRAMRAETIIGWRDAHYPGNVIYGQRSTWDSTSLAAAAATLSPTLIGYAQQMLDDNQFFASLPSQMKQTSLRSTAGLLSAPEDYEQIKAHLEKSASIQLPMTTPGDYIFTDEEDGVVALRHGSEILYFSLYWRSRPAINFLARVHHITPRLERIAVVREEIRYQDSGLIYTRPDWINMGLGNGGQKYPGDLHSAHTGEVLPIAATPPGIEQPKAGSESPYAGKGSFYLCRFGDYLIAMNCAADRDFDFTVPPQWKQAIDLVNHKPVAGATSMKVSPRSTIVLRVP